MHIFTKMLNKNINNNEEYNDADILLDMLPNCLSEEKTIKFNQKSLDKDRCRYEEAMKRKIESGINISQYKT